ncbi:EpsG-like putative glucosyltransferase [Ancylomarina subtilis]|uniref:EpsG-like putative glucosyltransferase n=1 Tax=Ancylomarina subtilis TaxID=1639035 RepID=A0A4Q7VKQ5_9BACT|nr:EpsG family protein [Ancylomarina subtilis]RZT96792.1 EpsG-like putative glucosyltransferase [Ancylomarina subtilis]
MDYYDLFNWILIGCIILSCLALMVSQKSYEENVVSKVLILSFCLLSIFYWGVRPSSVGTDTGYYIRRFNFAISYSSLGDYFNYISGDYFFGFIVYYISRLGSVTFYFISIAFFTMLGFYVFFMKLAKYHTHAILALLMVASMFSFPGMLSNIIRNGLAISFFLPCTYYTLQKDYKYAVLWGVASILSHESILLPIIGLLVIHFVRLPLKYYLLGYLACSLMAFANIGLHSFSFIFDFDIEKLNHYMNAEIDIYKVGFRLDFYLFNTLFLLVFLALRNSSIAFDRYLKLYIFLSSVFFLCFHIPFSDRFGIYSWVFIPIVLFLGTEHYNPKFRFAFSTLATFMLYFINQLVFMYMNVPTPDN